MTEFVRLLIEILTYLWPLRAVEEWERGVYYIFGRYWKTVGPGRWPVCPYFMDVRAVPVVPTIIGTPLQTITLSDGSTLTFSATATLCVTDAAAALNKVDNYGETVIELVSSVLAERLADVDPKRVQPEEKDRRRRLVEALVRDLDNACHEFGVDVHAVRFTNWVTGVRTYRLLMDKSTLTQ